MSRRINPNRVKIHRSYTARELSDLLGVHKNTVTHWQRSDLRPIEKRRPYLFQGATVRAFLASRAKARKRPCPTGMLYCFKCREPRRPAPTSIEYIRKPTGAGNLRATCTACGTSMNRAVRQASIPTVLPGLLVQITEAPRRLDGSLSPSLNCNSERQATA
jgi:hypothetical protein